MIAYDMDGVIVHNYIKNPLWLRHLLVYPTKFFKKNRDKMKIIITARRECWKPSTRILLWLLQLDCEVHYMPKKYYENGWEKGNAIKHKAETIARLGITEFYEDDERIANELNKKTQAVIYLVYPTKIRKLEKI